MVEHEEQHRPHKFISGASRNIPYLNKRVLTVQRLQSKSTQLGTPAKCRIQNPSVLQFLLRDNATYSLYSVTRGQIEMTAWLKQIYIDYGICCSRPL